VDIIDSLACIYVDVQGDGLSSRIFVTVTSFTSKSISENFKSVRWDAVEDHCICILGWPSLCVKSPADHNTASLLRSQRIEHAA
jgi:hypothetical protein